MVVVVVEVEDKCNYELSIKLMVKGGREPLTN